MATKEFSDHQPVKPYIFLSFAGADRAVAEQIEAYLSAAEVRVFYDKKSIPPGADWNRAISQALNECESMVLLLSSSSMPSDKRKEVYDEWFPFDQMGKTIYPLLISDCELDRRFVSKNYIDARTDLQSALDGLLAELLGKLGPAHRRLAVQGRRYLQHGDIGRQVGQEGQGQLQRAQAMLPPHGLVVEQQFAVHHHTQHLGVAR